MRERFERFTWYDEDGNVIPHAEVYNYSECVVHVKITIRCTIEGLPVLEYKTDLQ